LIWILLNNIEEISFVGPMTTHSVGFNVCVHCCRIRLDKVLLEAECRVFRNCNCDRCPLSNCVWSWNTFDCWSESRRGRYHHLFVESWTHVLVLVQGLICISPGWHWGPQGIKQLGMYFLSRNTPFIVYMFYMYSKFIHFIH
jgi:hypothetical protein